MSKRNLAITISGRKGDGKDTVAKIIMSKSFNLKRKTFGDSCKTMSSALTGIPIEHFYNRVHKDDTYYSTKHKKFVEESQEVLDNLLVLDSHCVKCLYSELLDKLNGTGNYYIKLRTIMQTVGDIFQELFGRDVFVKSTLGNIDNDVLVTDLRFKHELDYIQSKYTYVISIRVVNTSNKSNDSHISENVDLLDIPHDCIIIWDGSNTSELEKKVSKLLKKKYA